MASLDISLALMLLRCLLFRLEVQSLFLFEVKFAVIVFLQLQVHHKFSLFAQLLKI